MAVLNMASIEVDRDRLLRTFLELVGVDSLAVTPGREDSGAELLTGWTGRGVAPRPDRQPHWSVGTRASTIVLRTSCSTRSMDTIRPTEGMEAGGPGRRRLFRWVERARRDDKAGLAAIVEACARSARLAMSSRPPGCECWLRAARHYGEKI